MYMVNIMCNYKYMCYCAVLMKRLNEKQTEQLQIDWRTGQYTTRSLGDKWKVSPSTVINKCKGIAKDLKPVLTKHVELNRELANLNPHEALTVVQDADLLAKKLNYIAESAIENAKESMAFPCFDQNDFNKRADTLLKTKDAIVDKSADTAVQVNIGIEKMSREDLTRIAKGG